MFYKTIQQLFRRIFALDVTSNTAEPTEPSLTISSLTFSDGTSISIGPTDTVVFVGPNNSGKSAALREIQVQSNKPGVYRVTHGCTVEISGAPDEIENHIEKTSDKIFRHGEFYYTGYKYSIRQSNLSSQIERFTEDIRDFFVFKSSTGERLSGSNPARAITYRKDQPNHPIHLLVMDRDLENSISTQFYNAFGKFLYVNRAGGENIGLFVGDRNIADINLDSFSKESVGFFENEALPLEEQGDGMRAFASVALSSLALRQQTVVLIDEPEVFLHPPQARLLGRLIGAGLAGRQKFIATHSSDIVKGISDGVRQDFRLVRVTRKDNVNYVSHLDPKLLSSLSTDATIANSGILNAIFYKHIIICEADADCHFYRSILHSEAISGNSSPDVLFVQASGKQRIQKLVEIAKKLSVNVSTVVDIDIINDEVVFKELAISSGLDWSVIRPYWKKVFDAVEGQKAKISSSQIVTAIEANFNDLKSGSIKIREFFRKISEINKSSSPWDMIKRAGRSALPSGEVVDSFDILLKLCGENGLWIVPVGEMEGFCRKITARKSADWVATILDSYDLSNSEELTVARDFVKAMWDHAIENY